MKTTLLLLAAIVISFTAPARASAAELCGMLKGECLNGADCAHFVTNSAGEHAIFAANAEADRDLRADVEKGVCADGKYTRKGFEASAVRLSLAAPEAVNAAAGALSDALCLHNVECGKGYHHKSDERGCLRCVKNK